MNVSITAESCASTPERASWRSSGLPVGIALVLGASAQAQDVGGHDAISAGGLEVVTVTARKRTESVQDSPLSVTAISAEQIQRLDLSSLEKVSASTPQLSIARSSNGSGAQIALRGIGSSFTSIGIEQSVATVVDGVYYGQGRVLNEGFLDLEQIEIIKGPQSLFFGKNSTAGVVSLTTADPGDTVEIFGRTGYEFQAEEVSSEAVISGPLTQTLGLRLAVRGSKMSDGYVQNDAGPSSYTTFDVATGNLSTYGAPPADDSGPRERQLVARATLKWEPADAFTATIKASGNIDRIGNPAWNYVTFSCPNGRATFNPDQPCEREFRNYMNNVPQEVAASLRYANRNGDLSNDYDSYGLTATLNYELDSLTLTSVSNYNENRNTFVIDGDYFSSASNNTWATERTDFEAFSTEGRVLSSWQAPVNFLGGFYYQKTRLSLEQHAVLFGLENSATTPERRYLGWIKDSGTVDETAALFGQAIWEVTPAVELTAGVRYTHETKDSRFSQPYINPAVTAVFVENSPFETDQTFENWSPEATITWKPLSSITVYGAYKTGYKSGGFSNSGIHSVAGSVDDFSFAPEKAKGFEAGLKTTLLDRQLRFDLGVYHYEFENLQIDFFNSTTVSFITTNAGSARTDGVEAEFQYAPRALAAFRLHGALNYNRARYEDYLAPCFGGQTIAEGCTLVRNNLPYQDLSGRPPTSAPRWTAALGSSYLFRLGSDLVLDLGADARYSDEYLASSFGNTAARQPSYVTVDASVHLRTSDGRWELGLTGRNLTDRFVMNGSQDTVGTGSGTGTDTGVRSDVYGLVGFPRTVRLHVAWRY